MLISAFITLTTLATSVSAITFGPPVNVGGSYHTATGSDAGTSTVIVPGTGFTVTDVTLAVTTVGNCTCTDPTSSFSPVVLPTYSPSLNGTITINAAAAVNVGQARFVAASLFAAAVMAGLFT